MLSVWPKADSQGWETVLITLTQTQTQTRTLYEAPNFERIHLKPFGQTIPFSQTGDKVFRGFPKNCPRF